MARLEVTPIKVPNPFFERDNNAYLLDAGHLVLIDTGIDTADAFSALEDGIVGSGHKIEEIGKILLTHKHLDHFGMAHVLAKISGAEVYIHQDDLIDVTQFDARHDLIDSLYEVKMREWGIPQNLIDMLSMRSRLVKLGRSVPAIPLKDNQVLNIGGQQLKVIHTPGHTQGSSCFLIDEVLFTGDHLLPTYTPNVGATEVTAHGMLRKYRASLLKIKEYSGRRALPGHGQEMEDANRRIEEIMVHHDEREARILEILKDRGPRSVYQIAQELFGTLKEHHVLLGAGEVHAHLESLLSEKQVSSSENLWYVRYP